MRVLLFGASGMAGHVVTTYLSERGHDVTALAGHRKLDDRTILLDVTNLQALEGFLAGRRFDVVINCAGILIQQSEARKDLAAHVNAFFPHFLERRFDDTPVIHLSTDCVFSGARGPYREDSPYDGTSFYDRSKALGEIVNGKDLTLRMSIIGPDLWTDGSGLFGWFMAQRGPINGFRKVIWNGITTIELGKGIDAAIRDRLTGLYHLTPRDPISKYDLLVLCNATFGRGLVITPRDAPESDKTLINTRTDFAHAVPSYATMLAEMKAWIDAHPAFYPHYR